MDPLLIVALVCAALGVGFLSVAAGALKRRRLFRGLVSVLSALLMITLAALMVTITVAVQGYRALTREEVAATAVIQPAGPQLFMATLLFPDGRQQTFRIAGDQLYVDAHILKWKPIANLLGLHTAYELDRVGGRYFDIAQERDSTRTIFSLKQSKPLDMFTLRQRYVWLAPLLDAEYGSATFITITEPSEFEVRVSTTGLLIRRADSTGG